VGTNDAPGQQVATTLHDLKLTMTAEQYEQLVVALLATEEFRSRLLHVLANAHVADDDAPALAQLKKLEPEELSAGVTKLVLENPAILEDLGRHLMDRGPVELVEPARTSG
jgi:hypothetical protein